jgi:transcriptional regulator of acetoin/glycerol metabolism
MHASDPSVTVSCPPATRARLEDRGARDLARSGLRPEVHLSWTRSELCGVDPDRFDPRYEPDRVIDSAFVAVSAEVMDRAFTRVDGGPTGVMLTDAHGRIQRTWSGDKGVRDFLSRMGGEPGFVFSEDTLGTNGLGTALETVQAVKIRGAEHFLTAYTAFVCAAAPIRHPVTRVLLGAVNVGRRMRDDDDLLLPWAVSVAREIEDELLRRSTRVDRLMLDRFIAASRKARTAVVCLSEHMMISNPAARRIEELGQPFVWEEVARGASSGTFTLPNGATVPIRSDEVLDGGEAVGMVIEFDLRSPGRPGSRSPRPLPSPRDESSRDLHRQYADARRLLVAGGPGAGKATFVRRLLASAGVDASNVTWLDCALQEMSGPAWFRPLTERLAEPGAVVVVTHIELLGPAAVRTLCALLDRAPDDVRVFATTDSGSAADQALVDRLHDGRVEVPSLAERREEVRELVRALTERHARRRPPPIWAIDAIEALGRAAWPGNVRQLESVIRTTLARSQHGDVQVHHLPPEVLATVSSRSLSRLEQLEFTEMMRALTATKGNKAQASALLGIGRTTLYRRLRYFGIDPDHTFRQDRDGLSDVVSVR